MVSCAGYTHTENIIDPESPTEIPAWWWGMGDGLDSRSIASQGKPHCLTATSRRAPPTAFGLSLDKHDFPKASTTSSTLYLKQVK